MSRRRSLLRFVGLRIVPVVWALVSIPLPAAADWLMYRDGARLETRGEWRIEGKHVIFSLPNGTLSAVQLEELDLEASRELTRAYAARPSRSASSQPADRDSGRIADARLQPEIRLGQRRHPRATVRATPCLNRRAAPRSEARIEDCVPEGTGVEMLARFESWTQVRTDDGVRGWLSTDYLMPERPNVEVRSALVLTDADVGHVEDTQSASVSEGSLGRETAKLGLGVTKWAQEVGPNGTLIVGFLRNEGAHVSTSVTLHVQALDHELNLVHEQLAKLDTTVLGPRRATRFEALLEGVFSFRELRFVTASTDLETADSEGPEILPAE